MTEREIRGILRQVFARLDERARRAVHTGVRKVVLPSMLGAGLALSQAGCDGRDVSQHDATAQTDGGVKQDLGTPQVEYMAPDPDGGTVKMDGLPAPAYMGPDMGDPQPPYMAPDMGEPQVEYMAPDPDAGTTKADATGPALDAGSVLLYQAPFPDGGAIPPYMAPDMGDPQIDYMAPDPDANP